VTVWDSSFSRSGNRRGEIGRRWPFRSPDGRRLLVALWLRLIGQSPAGRLDALQNSIEAPLAIFLHRLSLCDVEVGQLGIDDHPLGHFQCRPAPSAARRAEFVLFGARLARDVGTRSAPLVVDSHHCTAPSKVWPPLARPNRFWIGQCNNDVMSESNPPTFRHDSFKKSSPHDRRTFLRRTLGVGVVAGAAVAGAVYLEERRPSSVATTTTRPSPTTTTTSGPATAASWTQLGTSLTGSLVLPSNPRYAIDRLLYNSKFVNLHPRAIAYCATPDDVARCSTSRRRTTLPSLHVRADIVTADIRTARA